MMAQYRRIKSELPRETLLLFRLGDFYEMFFEDAQIGAGLLNVALTKRGSVPMCGIPAHSANGHIAKLLKGGRKVAICDQLEEAKPGQLVKREVTQILSPGTHFDDRVLVAEKNNYLAAVISLGQHLGLAVVDLTTGHFRTTQTETEQALLTEIERLRPAEIIYPSDLTSLAQLLRPFAQIVSYDDWVFAPETAVYTLKEHFKVASLDGFGLRGKFAAMSAAGGVVHYLTQTLRRDLTHLRNITYYESSNYLTLDATTLRNLEIVEPLHSDGQSNTSLYGALNRTVTPMGARRLRDWLTQPLASVGEIERRQQAVCAMLTRSRELEKLRTALKEIRDLERTVGRLGFGSANARDLQALRGALDQIPTVKQLIHNIVSADLSNPSTLNDQVFESSSNSYNLLSELDGHISALPELSTTIVTAIVDEPPLTVKEGGMIRAGFDSSLDELRSASTEGKNWIAKMQQEEIEKTGISSLKVRFNSVFGYFIEVTKTNLDKVPANYIRKQTIVNGERFITPELKEIEGKILGAEERSVKLEYEIFQRVRESVLIQLPTLQQTADALAQLDVLAAFAEVAQVCQYCRPIVKDEGILQIRDGRHPVLDQRLTEERFVPNDIDLDRTGQQIMLITGPNMAGKSTYIRQTALLAIMAHTGSYIPATHARVDLIDRIFTRIGASDDLSRGQSTFMVEMTETANILNNATPRSLVILDEVGRGTSTFDGLSLAWSIVEHLHNQVGSKTLFATHYHELTELASRLKRVKNFNVAVREWNDQVIFLRKIIPGGADKSYGIQVARLAGVPKPVLERAKEILNNLEESELTPEGKVRQPSRHRAERDKLKTLAPAPQLDLFS